jgi:predicted metalloprotease with PDZ domain
MRILLAGLLSIGLSNNLSAQHYEYTADLANVTDDQVKVTCIVPRQENKEAEFIFANLIPGSYAYKEYGRYIDDFKAYDENGAALKTGKVDKFSYTIHGADHLARVEYMVNDSWEEKNGKKFIFQPGGTNIEGGKNFVINNFGFFGYIEGMQNIPFDITFIKPEHLKGYSYLPILPAGSGKDKLHAASFDELADNPVMYCSPNDTSFKIGDATIEVCVYSDRGWVQAAMMGDVVKPVALALQNFFGTLPVDRYVFMFYHADADQVPTRRGKGMGSGFGALEHNHCSFYFMPEVKGFEKNKEMFQDVCSHEFLHILTPLNLHSREIENFNFRKPVMSQHLWMYEGVTEYFSHLVLMRDSLISVPDFMKEIRRDINKSGSFDLFSMTEMSRNVVENANQKRYLSVYSRGAVLAMMLDILIIDLSKGTNSLQQVLMTLSGKYGPAKPFNDDELIGEIVKLTYPEVKTYFDRFIIGAAMPDYANYLNRIGYDLIPEFEKQVYFFGNFGLQYNEETGEYSFAGVDENIIGIHDGDVLVSVNDELPDPDNIEQLWDKYFYDNESDALVKFEIRRSGVKKKLEASPRKGVKHITNYITTLENPTEEMIRNFRKFSGREFGK